MGRSQKRKPKSSENPRPVLSPIDEPPKGRPKSPPYVPPRPERERILGE